MTEPQTTASIILDNKREIATLLLMGGLLFYGYLHWQAPLVSVETPKPTEQLELQQIEIHEYSQNQEQWVLRGSQATVLEDSDFMTIQDARLETVVAPSELSQDPAGAKVAADEAVVYWKAQQVFLTGNVVLSHESGATLHADAAEYHYQQGLFKIPEAMTIHREQDIIHGRNLKYHVVEGSLQFDDAVMSH